MCDIVPIFYTWTLTLGVSLLNLAGGFFTCLVDFQLYIQEKEKKNCVKKISTFVPAFGL